MAEKIISKEQQTVNDFDKILKTHYTTVNLTYHKIVEICYEDLIFKVLDLNNAFDINIDDDDDECIIRGLIYTNFDVIINDYYEYYNSIIGSEEELLAKRREKWLKTDLYKQIVEIINILQNNK